SGIVARMRTKRETVEELLSQTSLKRLRKEVRTNRRWQTVFGGFRPDSLTRSQFLQRGTVQFTTRHDLFLDLCATFVDGLGVPPRPDLRHRFQTAAELTSLDDPARELCHYLASCELAPPSEVLDSTDSRSSSGTAPAAPSPE